MLISILAIIWFLLVLVWGFYQVRQFYKFSHKDDVGLVTSNLNNLKNILEQILESDKKVSTLDTKYFIELGSGRAVISDYIAQNYLFKKVIAIENDWLIHTWASTIHLIKVKLLRVSYKTNLSYINQSVFDFDYLKHDGSKIFYCYLFPQILDKLYKEGVFKNSIVISLSFQIPNLQASQTHEIPNGLLQKKLFIYDFADNTSKENPC